MQKKKFSYKFWCVWGWLTAAVWFYNIQRQWQPKTGYLFFIVLFALVLVPMFIGVIYLRKLVENPRSVLEKPVPETQPAAEAMNN